MAKNGNDAPVTRDGAKAQVDLLATQNIKLVQQMDDV